jgi:MraZ protein
MGMFLSTFLMRVDKKGRVSVPASFRAALSADAGSIIAFKTLGFSAIDARGRAEFESLLATLRSHTVANLGPELAILGGAAPSPDQIVAATAADIPFDGEGRIILPEAFIAHAGISEQVQFVGRGSFFQMWSPQNFAEREAEELRQMRERLLGAKGAGS